MGNDMGNISGEMRGTVIRSEHVEQALAEIPEQVWMFDMDRTVTPGNYANFFAEVPMARRREIVALALGAATRLPI